MVKKFTGQVKASDIQEEFDLFTEEINKLIDIYNASINTSDIDFTTGSNSLGAYNYTLTVGGLKTILRACTGTVIGCRPFKDGNNLIITEGLIITSNAIYRVPYHVFNNYNDWLVLYNPTTGQWTSNRTWTYPEGYYRIAETEMRREYCPDVYSFRNAQLEGTEFRIKVRDRYFDIGGGSNMGINEPLTSTDRPVFICAGERIGDDTAGLVRLFGRDVNYNDQGDSGRRRNWYLPVNYFYLPKGCQNPYSYLWTNNWNDWWDDTYNGAHQAILEVDKKFTHKRN